MTSQTESHRGEKDKGYVARAKLAFFDVDGTLSAPLYLHRDGSRSLGFSSEGWLEYCEDTKDEGYMTCRPLPCVREFAGELKKNGCRLFVLSFIMTDREPGAKIRFLEKYYPGLFEDYFFVRDDPEKLPLMERVAEENGCALSDCMLVEDMYDTLLKAYVKGVMPIHVTNIVTGNYTEFR